MDKRKKRFPVMKPAMPRQDVTYSLVAEAGTRFSDLEESFLKTIDCVQGWLTEKAVFSLPEQATGRESYVAEEGGHRIECVSLLEKGIWAARFSHPDFGVGTEIKPVAGRYWTLDMAVEQQDEAVRFSIRVACFSPPDCDAPLAYIRPGIIRRLADDAGLTQERPLSRAPWILHSEKELEELESLLTAPGRRMPVFLITQPDKRRWTHTPTPPPYLLDGNWLASQTIGYAHVVLMPFDLGYEWTRKVGMPWSAFDGAVRVYLPRLNFDEDMPKRHVVFFKDRIVGYKYQEQTGQKAFSAHAADIVKPYNAHQLIVWQELPFVPRARTLLADLQIEKITDTTSIDEVKRLYEGQAAALRQQLDEAEKLAEQLSDDALDEKKAREVHEEENKDLRRRVQFLMDSLTAKSGKAVDDGIILPKDYDEMAEWVSDQLAGRLVLHPRAARSLKDAQYEDPQLVAKSLLLLANEYRDLRSGRIEKEKWEKALNDLHLEYKGSISEHNAGEFGETYYVRFPVGSAQRQFLKWHLRKGTSHEARHCLAIYFFWDDDTEQVVVGSLPAHLDNQMT